MKKMLIVMLAGMMALGLCACSFKVGSPADAEKYHAGNAEIKDKVESLDIDWAAGSVDLVLKEGDSVILEEEYAGSLPEEQKMHWYLDGTTLKVRYDIKMTLGINALNKKLTVTLPKDIKLKDLDVDVASARVNADSIAAENADIDTASGDVNIAFSDAVKAANFDTASGKVAVDFAKSADSLDIDTASGSLLIHAKDAVKAVKISSASGAVTGDFVQVPERMDISTASGDVDLGLPENADCTIDFDSASGVFDSAVPFSVKGKQYVSGSGSAKFSIDTASGDLRIRSVK